jgi:hypothetical protein
MQASQDEMPDDQVLNPFINLFPDRKNPGKWLLQAPLPGKGLQRLNVDEEHFPALFELCAEHGDAALQYFDLENDSSDDEKAELVRAGILISRDREPKKPVFSCMLDSLADSHADVVEDEIVDPTVVYEGFDLTKFRTWAAEKNLSPFLPSIWIQNRQTGLRSGYWVTQEQGPIVAALKPGERPPTDLDPTLAARLRTAGVITSQADLDKKEDARAKEIAEAAASFREHGYAVLRNIIPALQMPAVQSFYREFEDQGFMTLGDEFIPLRFVSALEPFASTIHRDLTTLTSRLASQDVKPAYCYASSYLGGADLPPHRDRPQCEFSFSVQVDYRPAPTDGISPWPLCLSIDRNEKAIHLGPGDCLAYKGCEVTHSRPRLPEGHRSTSLFLHYVPLDFSGELS